MRKANRKKRLIIAASAAVFTVALTVLLLAINKPQKLAIVEQNTGRVFWETEAQDGDIFSVTFLHSVNLSPVEEAYRVQSGEIYLDSCVYYAFGAGVATEVVPPQTLSYTEDGAMVISGYDQKVDDLCYIVSTVYDHIFTFQETEINLTTLCGKNAKVRFEVR